MFNVTQHKQKTINKLNQIWESYALAAETSVIVSVLISVQKHKEFKPSKLIPLAHSQFGCHISMGGQKKPV